MTIQEVMPNTASAAATTGSTTGTTSANSLGDMDTTFMNLLITELKSQDPTAPMDATQMVGQMVSLNQLDQLIGIHQILQTNANPATTKGTPATAKGAN
jgi:flagellar basal-body rod modification protein FlgD